MTDRPTYRYLVDWDNDGFICRDARPGDALNLLPFPLSWTGIGYKGYPSATVSLLTETTAYGWRVLRAAMAADLTDSLEFGITAAAVVDQIAVIPNAQYTASVRLRGASAWSGESAKLIVSNASYSVLAVSSDLALSDDWQQVTVTFTAGASDDFVYFRVEKVSSTALLVLDATGFMLVMGSVAPSGFNVAATRNLIPTPTTWAGIDVTTTGTSPPTVTHVGGLTAYGVGHLHIVTDATAGNPGVRFGATATAAADSIPVEPGVTYTWSMWVRSISGATGFRLIIRNQAGTALTATIATTMTGDWQQVSVTFTTTAATQYVYAFAVRANVAQAATFDLTGFTLIAGSTALSDPLACSNLYDDLSAWVQSARWSLGFRKPFERVADDVSADLILDNSTKLWSPDDASGALYGALLPQRTLLIESEWGGVTRRHFTGWTDFYQPAYGDKRGPFTGRIVARGLLPALKATKLNLPLLEDVSASEIIRAVLGRSTFPPGATGGRGWALGVPGRGELGVSTFLTDPAAIYSLDDGRNTYPYVGDTFDKFATAFDALVMVAEAERGKLFQDRAGRLVFWDRTRFQSDVTVQETFTNVHGLGYAHGDDLVNKMTVKTYPRALSAADDETLWTLDEPLEIDPGQEREVRARYAAAEGQTVSGRSVRAPNLGDGTLVMQLGNVTVLRFEPEARSARIVFKNESTWQQAIIGVCTIKGQKVTAWNPLEVAASDAESIAAYGLRELVVDARLLSSERTARRMAENEVALRKTPRGMASSLSLMNKPNDTTYWLAILSRTLGDRIRVTEAQTAHSGEYFIVGEEHQVRDTGHVHTVTWTLEPAAPYVGWLLGVVGRGELGQATRIGY